MRFLPLVFLLLISIPAFGQDAQLRKGQAHTASLNTGDQHTYTIDAKDGQFVFARVHQNSVDVALEILDPSGQSVRKIDGPARGAELVQFETETDGEYRITVSPFEDEEGEYAIVLEKLEAIAKKPGQRVDQLMTAYSAKDSPGAAVQVWKDGKTLFSKAYGAADLTYGMPFTVETPTNIGSTSKQFTAFAVMLLVEDGKLTLDDDVRMHIPELPDFGTTVTVRNLLTHTTGYREFLNLATMDGRQLGHGDWIDRDEIVGFVQRQPKLQNEPGAEFNYNNTAFALAAEMVSRISEQPFPEFMADRVFGPIGMTHTQVRPSPEHILPGRSIGYTPGDGGYLEIGDLGGAMGAGGIYSTIGDLQRWAENLRNPRVGTAEIVTQMQTSYVLSTGDSTGYGLGLFLDEHRGLDRIHHGGADVAHRSQLARYPTINAGLTTQSNHAGFDGSIPFQIAELFFGDYMEDADAPAEAAPDDEAPWDPASFDPEILDDYVGGFALDAVAGFVLTFTREGDELFTQATGQQKLQVFPTSDSTFALRVVEASVTFHRDGDGSVNRITLHQNGDKPATRVSGDGGGAWEPTADELAAFAGRYFSEEVEAFYTIWMEDDGLVIKHRRSSEAKLSAAERDAFAGGALGQMTFERDKNDQIIAFYASNGRTRDVRFVRVPDSR
ncbi:MAG: CubicO group peptidase (beta-lactamase class C family) [Rhodothermales bacterium]|jgi:CubicO group peptidase (beta-lactamase class C family)